MTREGREGSGVEGRTERAEKEEDRRGCRELQTGGEARDNQGRQEGFGYGSRREPGALRRRQCVQPWAQAD